LENSQITPQPFVIMSSQSTKRKRTVTIYIPHLLEFESDEEMFGGSCDDYNYNYVFTGKKQKTNHITRDEEVQPVIETIVISDTEEEEEPDYPSDSDFIVSDDEEEDEELSDSDFIVSDDEEEEEELSEIEYEDTDETDDTDTDDSDYKPEDEDTDDEESNILLEEKRDLSDDLEEFINSKVRNPELKEGILCYMDSINGVSKKTKPKMQVSYLEFKDKMKCDFCNLKPRNVDTKVVFKRKPYLIGTQCSERLRFIENVIDTLKSNDIKAIRHQIKQFKLKSSSIERDIKGFYKSYSDE
jgi:hypothetical protein